MPRYTNALGVVVDIPAELAARLGGYTPVEAGADLDPDDVLAWLDAEAVWHANVQNDSVAEWLAAEESYQADVTAWLEAETAHRNQLASKAAASGRAGRK